MPRIIDHEFRKQEILEKSRDVFEKHGYRNTNLLEIAKNCNIGRTTIYQYFKNKDEIFYEILSNSLKEINSQIESIRQDNKLKFKEKIKEIIYRLTTNEKNTNTFVLLLEVWIVLKRENNKTLDKIKYYIRNIKDTLTDIIDDAIEAKEIKVIDSKILAVNIYTLIETFALERTSYELDTKKKIESIHLLIDSLGI
ncbi:TetR/AcrR family transcriptional regulator [Wansuia hejianensis]|uniref:TetR/AcrR family transcriptional regulator n=1 Tax=Wansuia hejianensis TaxID=2763667 RepID=A0A926EXN7_9FIRM|nr:TetR/AcrR family transcriptional regulator [Wansuia hejianensis]